MSDEEYKAGNSEIKKKNIRKLIKCFCVLLLIVPLILILIPRYTVCDWDDSIRAAFGTQHMMFMSAIMIYEKEHDGVKPKSFKDISSYFDDDFQNIVAATMEDSYDNETYMSTFSMSYKKSADMANYTITVDSGNNLLLTSKLQREEDKYIITWDGEKQEKIATGIYEKYCN